MVDLDQIAADTCAGLSDFDLAAKLRELSGQVSPFLGTAEFIMLKHLLMEAAGRVEWSSDSGGSEE